MNQAKLEASLAKYNEVTGWDDYPRDENGFMHLRWSAEKTDSRLSSLTTDISSLEAKLKKFKEEKAEKEKYKKTDDYKNSKKAMSKKKAKKKKESLLEMVFNNADFVKAEREADEEDAGGKVIDGKKKKSSSSKKSNPNTTLDTTYGTRYAPMVEMYYDMINEFDVLAKDIEAELETMKGPRHQTRYKSDQMSNLLSAKKSKADMIKEVVSIANKVSELEYKKEKDKKDESVGNISKEVSNLGAKYLRGSFDIYDMGDSDKKKGKKGKKDKDEVKKKKAKDYDDDEGSIKKVREKNSVSDTELAAEFAKALERNKDNLSFTPAEMYVAQEGKYNVVVIGDMLDIEHDWRFAAVSKKGKEIENFKKDYPGLLPRKNGTRMKFDLNRMKATDLNTGRTYKILAKS